MSVRKKMSVPSCFGAATAGPTSGGPLMPRQRGHVPFAHKVGKKLGALTRRSPLRSAASCSPRMIDARQDPVAMIRQSNYSNFLSAFRIINFERFTALQFKQNYRFVVIK